MLLKNEKEIDQKEFIDFIIRILNKIKEQNITILNTDFIKNKIRILIKFFPIDLSLKLIIISYKVV